MMWSWVHQGDHQARKQCTFFGGKELYRGGGFSRNTDGFNVGDASLARVKAIRRRGHFWGRGRDVHARIAHNSHGEPL